MHLLPLALALLLPAIGPQAARTVDAATGASNAHATRPRATPAATPDPSSTWIDLDADGRVDLVELVAGAPRILLNRGSDGFVDATGAWGVGELEDVVALVAYDVDADGAVDLVASRAGVPLLLRGDRSMLVDATVTSGLETEFPVRSIALHDIDLDGRADALLAGDGGARALFRNLGELTFERVVLPERAAWTPVETTASERASAPTASEGRLDASGRTGDRTVASSPSGTNATNVSNGAATTAGGTASTGGDASTRARSRAPAPSGAPGTGGRVALTPTGSVCLPTIEDAAGSGCLSASTVPTLGALYPLSNELYVDLAGRIGLGTLAPRASAHLVAGGVPLLDPSALDSEDLVVESADARLGLYSHAGGGVFGSGLVLGELDGAGLLNDRWALVRGSNFGTPTLNINYSMLPGFSPTTNLVVVAANGRMSVGAPTVGIAQLQVVNKGTTGPVLDAVMTHGGSTQPVLNADTAGTGPALRARTEGAYAIDAEGITLTNAPGANYALRAESLGGAAGFFEGSIVMGDRQSIGGTDVGRVILDHNASNAGRATFWSGGTVVAQMLVIDAVETGSGGAAIRMKNNALQERLVLDADQGDGKSRVVTDVLEVRGGADLVERFETREDELEPGTVVVIDPLGTGRLTASSERYDKRVAGVVSGAGGIDPGLSLGQAGVTEGDTQVALTGRVYVKASIENGPIRPGDRLTTAALVGHAMRVDEAEHADGAVLGKALSLLDAGNASEDGTGLVLVLVNLQ